MDVILDRNAKQFIKPNLIEFYSKNITRIYNSKYNSLYKDQERNSKSELELDIFNNEILKILERDPSTYSEDDKNLLLYYKSFMLKYLKQCREIFITNPILNDKMLCQRFMGNDYSIVEEYHREYEEVAMKLLKRFINKEKISTREEKVLFQYFSSKVGALDDDSLEYQTHMIREILSRDQVDMTGKEFLIRYFTHEKCQKLGLPDAKVYVGNTTPFGDSMGTANGISFGVSGIICMNEDVFSSIGKDKDPHRKITYNTLLIHVTNHELEHYRDSDEMKNGKVTIGAWKMTKNSILRKYLSSKDFDEYKVNYRYRESERKANSAGYIETSQIISKYMDLKDSSEDLEQLSKLQRDTSFGQSESYQTGILNGVTYHTTMEKYNFGNLVNIVGNHPGLVQSYNLLGFFFDSNGNCKRVGSILKEYTKVLASNKLSLEETKNYREIYSEFFDYIFDIKDLNLFNDNMSNFTEEEKIVWFKEVRDSYGRECRRLKNMMDIYEPNKNGQFDFIAGKRIQKIKKYHSYLMDNQYLVPGLTESNANREKRIYPVLELKKDQLVADVESFQDRIDRWNTCVAENSSLAKDIKLLSDITGKTDSGSKAK